MEGTNRIGEVRGILPHQGVEPVMQEALDVKLSEFGAEADAYRKKSADMRTLTALERKKEIDAPFSKDDLLFLYEINFSIEGFGYERDPRIAELRAGRNPDEDTLVIFECTRDQIAHVPSEINEDTKAYVGQLEPGIFEKFSVREEFVAGKKSEQATLIHLTVADLGFKTSATIDQIYERAQALGLELCPADTGPQYRLQYRNQPLNEWVFVGMKQITDPDGNPNVFTLERRGDGLWLYYPWALPGRRWTPDYPFVFRLRKSKT